MDAFYRLTERIETYRILMGKGEWDKAEFEQKLAEVHLLYASAVSAAEALLDEAIKHYDALKEQEDGLQVPVHNGD